MSESSPDIWENAKKTTCCNAVFSRWMGQLLCANCGKEAQAQITRYNTEEKRADLNDEYYPQ